MADRRRVVGAGGAAGARYRRLITSSEPGPDRTAECGIARTDPSAAPPAPDSAPPARAPAPAPAPAPARRPPRSWSYAGDKRCRAEQDGHHNSKIGGRVAGAGRTGGGADGWARRRPGRAPSLGAWGGRTW